MGGAINHSRRMGSIGDFFSSFSHSFPVHLLSLNPSHPPLTAQPTLSQGFLQDTKRSAILYPSPCCSPSGAGETAGKDRRGCPGDFGVFCLFSLRSRAGCCCSHSLAVVQEVLCHLLPPAAATLITIKLAVLEGVTTLGQSRSPWLRDDAGNH